MTQKKRQPAMTAQEFDDLWRNKIKAASLAEVHRKLQTPYPTVRDWNRGDNPIPGVARAALKFWKENIETTRKILAVQNILDISEDQDPAAILEAIKKVLDDPPTAQEEQSIWK